MAQQKVPNMPTEGHYSQAEEREGPRDLCSHAYIRKIQPLLRNASSCRERSIRAGVDGIALIKRGCSEGKSI